MSYDMQISLLAVFYILIIDNLLRPLDSLVLISSLGFYFMYGFLINDFFDLPYDIAAGKQREIQGLPKIKFLGIILIIVTISAAHLLYLKKIEYVIIYVIAYIFATLYSAPPLRFKSRALSGIVVNGLIEKMLPVLSIFVYFNHTGIDMIIFLAASFFIQISEIITHQIHDHGSDLKSNVQTFVVSVGLEKALDIFRTFISPFTVLLMIILSIIIIQIQHAVLIVTLVVMTYAIIHLLIYKGRLKRDENIFPLYMSCPHFLVHNAFPPFLAFILILRSPLNAALFLIAICSQYNIIKNLINILRRKNILREELSDT